MDDFFKYIKDGVEERYDTSNYAKRRKKRPLPVGKKQKK